MAVVTAPLNHRHTESHLTPPTWVIEPEPRPEGAGFRWNVRFQRRSEFAAIRVTTHYGGWERSYRRARRNIRRHMKAWGVPRKERP